MSLSTSLGGPSGPPPTTSPGLFDSGRAAWNSHEAQIAPWLYFGAITFAEIVTAVVHTRWGLVLHGIILLVLVFHGARMPDETSRRFVWTLILCPLIRLMSLSMPLSVFPIYTWYFFTSVPLLTTSFLLARGLSFTRAELGFVVSTRNIPADVLIIAACLPLGFVEYSILRPDLLVVLDNWQIPALTALILTVSTGFSEEFMFRGLMQSAGFPILRRLSPLYVNLMFSVLHMGYQSIVDLVFVFAVGMLFSWYVLRSGSIVAVTLRHSLVNITLFNIAPLFIGGPL